MKLKLFGAAAAAMLLIGCNGADTGATADGTRPNNQAMTVGVVFDSGGRGDKSFNDSAYAGIERAEREFGIVARAVESRSEKDYEANLRAMADQGVDIVFAIGIGQEKALQAVAPNYPNVKFAIVDAVVEQPNVRSLVFSEEEGSFLAGYLAGLTTETGRIGFVGGKSIPLIKKFEAGYIAGARTARPDITILPSKYTESWDDVSTGKAAAEILYRGGADIVYHAAGRSGLGVITAAKDHNRFAIGVDSDQDDVAPGNVLTSMIKRVDEAVFQTIRDVREGNFTAEVVRYDLARDGVGLSPMTHTRDKVGQDRLTRVQAIAERIKSGELQVPTTEAELQTYLAQVR
jgi:basic membrane protein A and related proteins